MKFCTQCDNMYYLAVDEEDINKLIYYCRNCKNVDNTIISEGSCIINTYSTKNNNMNFNHVINNYTKLDPTLPRMKNIKCPLENLAIQGCHFGNFHKEKDKEKEKIFL